MYHAEKAFGKKTIEMITSCVSEWINTLTPEERKAAEARTREKRERAKTTSKKLVERHAEPLIELLLRAARVSSPDTFEVSRGQWDDWTNLDSRLVVYVLDKLFGCTVVYDIRETEGLMADDIFRFRFKSESDFQAFFKFDTVRGISWRLVNARSSVYDAERGIAQTEHDIKRAEEAIKHLECLRQELEQKKKIVAERNVDVDKLAARLERRKALEPVSEERSSKKAKH